MNDELMATIDNQGVTDTRARTFLGRVGCEDMVKPANMTKAKHFKHSRDGMSNQIRIDSLRERLGLVVVVELERIAALSRW